VGGFGPDGKRNLSTFGGLAKPVIKSRASGDDSEGGDEIRMVFANPLKQQNPNTGGISESLYEDDEESLEDFDIDLFETDAGIKRMTTDRWDHRFHRVFAFLLHFLTGAVTFFSFKFVLNPKDIKHEYYVYLMNPFSLVSIILIMLGTDELLRDVEEDSAKTVQGFCKAVQRSPNLLYTVLSLFVQKMNMLIGHIKVNDINLMLGDVSMIIALPILGKILYRQRVKMGLTIGDDEQQDLPRDRVDSHQNQSRNLNHAESSHSDHVRNSNNFKLRESQFKELILTELPKIGIVTFITAAYFTVESYGCIQNVTEQPGLEYCYKFTGDELTKQCESKPKTCKDGGLGECEDVIHSSEVFATFFVMYAALRLYVQPLASLRYTENHLIRFDILFRDQIQLSLFGLSAFLSLYIFASSDEIDDWCGYVNPREGSFISKRSLKWRQGLRALLRLVFLLVFIIIGFSKDLNPNSRFGKFAYGWHKVMRTKEPCSLAPVIRVTLALVAIIGVLVNVPFIFFATKAFEEGEEKQGLKMAKKAENSYCVCISLFAIQYFSVGLFYFSRPRYKEMVKNFVYATLPISSALSTLGCFFMYKWEEKTNQATAAYNMGRFEAGFYSNLSITFLSIAFFPFVRRSLALLGNRDIYTDKMVSAHLSMLSSQIQAVVAPAMFLFAESAGCVHSKSFRECYALFEANFTVELQLILAFVYFLLYGFTLARFNVDDLMNFKAPLPIILQFWLIFISSMASFAVFGMRPRDIPEKRTDTEDEFYVDASTSFAKAAQIVIILCWLVNYIAQGLHVYRFKRRGEQGTVGNGTKLETWFLKAAKKYLFVEEEKDTRLSPFFIVQSMLICCLAIVFTTLQTAYALQEDTHLATLTNSTSPNERKAATFHGAFKSVQDYGYLFFGIVIFGNMNASSHRSGYRWRDVFMCITIVFPLLLSAVTPGCDQRLMIILASLLAIGCFIILKAKAILIENYSHVELKKHMLSMTHYTLMQMPPVVFLSAEYSGCLLRAGTVPNLSIEAIDKGDLCGKIRTGCRAVSFQVAIMLLVGWATGVFTKYGDDKEELTLKKIAKLEMNNFHIFHLSLLSTTSFIALYLFGTRGKSTEPVTESEPPVGLDLLPCDMDCRWNLLTLIYVLWFIMFCVDVSRRIFLTLNDKDFMADINLERESDIKGEAGSVKPQIRTRLSIWNIGDGVDSEPAALQASEKHEKIKTAKTTRFKKAKTRSTVEAFDFDFAPGML